MGLHLEANSRRPGSSAASRPGPASRPRPTSPNSKPNTPTSPAPSGKSIRSRSSSDAAGGCGAVLRRSEARDGAGMPRLRIRRMRRGDERGTCDRMKTTIPGEDADRSVIHNPSLVALLDHYGSAPKACKACRAKTKGKVERPFHCIRQDFFLDRTFRSFGGPDAQFDNWRGKVANPRVHATTGRIVDQAFTEEQCSLIPLPAHPLRHRPDRRAARRPRRNGLRRRKPPFGAGRRTKARAGGAAASRRVADLRRQDADRPASGPRRPEPPQGRSRPPQAASAAPEKTRPAQKGDPNRRPGWLVAKTPKSGEFCFGTFGEFYFGIDTRCGTRSNVCSGDSKAAGASSRGSTSSTRPIGAS